MRWIPRTNKKTKTIFWLLTNSASNADITHCFFFLSCYSSYTTTISPLKPNMNANGTSETGDAALSYRI